MSETQSVTNGKTPPLPRDGKKRKFDVAFKKACAARVKAGETAQHVADEFKISSSTIARWVKGEALGPMGGVRGVRKTKKKRLWAAKKPRSKRAYKKVDESSPYFLLLPIPVKDAIKFLKLAEQSMYTALRESRISGFDEAHDLSRMALRELQKLQER